MKTIYSLLVVLLFTQIAPAQTNAPATTNDPATAPATPLPTPRRPVPLRGTNLPAASTTSTNVSGAPTPLAPPAIQSLPTLQAPPTLQSRTTAAPTEMRTNPAGQTEAADIVYDVREFPLEQALQIYSKLVGRTMLRSPQLQPTLQLTLKTETPLTKSEAIMAWETIMGMNGITVVPIGDKFMKIVQEAQAPAAGGKFSELSAEELPDAGKYLTHIVNIKYAIASEVQSAITPFAKSPQAIINPPNSNTLIIRDYSENVKRMLEVIDKIDTLNEMHFKPEVIPIKYALASDIQQVLGSLTASGPGASVGRSTRGASTTPGGYQPGAPGQNPMQGQPNPQPGQSPLSSAGSTRQSAFQNNLQRIVGRLASGAGDFQVLGAAKIISDDRTNSLLIFANDQDMVMIKTIIEQLDVVLAQVLIEAIIMEVSLDNTLNYGVSYLHKDQNNAGGLNNLTTDAANFLTGGGGGTNAVAAGTTIASLPGGFSYFAKINDNFNVALTAIESDGRVNVLSRPRIQTSHAVPATLFIGDTVPYITGSSFGDFGGISSRSTYQEKRVGITLDVLPLINPDGLVVMDIQQNIQQLGTTIEIDGNDVPQTTERSASAKVAVRDRETIILGGFITSTKNKSKSGIPILKDVPLLGALFRSTSDIGRRVELIILMRPTVLPTPEAAALVAASEKDKMSGVKQGEWELREEERKRQEAIEKDMRKKLGLKERSY